MPRACPRDATAMVEQHAGRVHVDVCPTCHGSFLDGIELHRVVGNAELAFELAAMHGMADHASVPCPACSAPMSVNSLDGITLDHCRQCLGVWLDHGELDRLASRSLTTFAHSRAPVLDMTLRDLALALRKE